MAGVRMRWLPFCVFSLALFIAPSRVFARFLHNGGFHFLIAAYHWPLSKSMFAPTSVVLINSKASPLIRSLPEFIFNKWHSIYLWLRTRPRPLCLFVKKKKKRKTNGPFE